MLSRTAQIGLKAASVLPLLLLSACLFGSSNTSPPAVNTATTETEFERNYALASINSQAAYDLGITGDGVIVAVIDSGIDTDHIDLDANISAFSTGYVNGQVVSVEDSFGHGTAIAGVIAAEKNDLGMHGVAYNAQIMAINVDQGGGAYSQLDITWATDYAHTNGAKVLNYSFSGAFPSSVFLTDAMGRAVDAGALIVVAAGNAGGADPEYPARNAADFDGRSGAVLAVGSVDENNEIVASSNRAGVIQNYFVVAPGDEILTTFVDDQVGTFNGTSFSAAHVSGAAALILEHSPHLTGSQVSDILTSTATDLGAAGIDSVYGHGLINVEAALQPVGPSGIPTSSSVDGPLISVGTSQSTTTAGLGLAFKSASLLDRALLLDSYGRAYTTDLTASVQGKPEGLTLDSWMTSRRSSSSTSARVFLTPVRSFDISFARQSFSDTGEEILGSDGEADFIKASFTERLGEGRKATLSLGESLARSFGPGFAAAKVTDLDIRQEFSSPFLGLADQGLSFGYEQKLGSTIDAKFGYTSNLLNGGLAIQSSSLTQPANAQSALVGDISLKAGSALQLGILAGRLYEESTLLDSYSTGAFGFDGESTTDFASLYGVLRLNSKASLLGRYSFGRTNASSLRSALVRSFDSIQSDGFAVGLAVQGGLAERTAGRYQDHLLVSVSQPLRVTNGTAVLDVPIERTVDGEVIKTNEWVSLVPSGREINARASYLVEADEKTSLEFLGQLRFQPEHDANAKTESLFGLVFRKALN